MVDYEQTTSLSYLETKLNSLKQNTIIYVYKIGKTWGIQSCIWHIMRSLAGLNLFDHTRKRWHHEYVAYEKKKPAALVEC